MKPVPIFQNPALQNTLSYLNKLTKDELGLIQFVIQGLIDKKPKLTPKEVAETINKLSSPVRKTRDEAVEELLS
jgi:NifB/MoaA-like Fe-S oxidoreductase